MHAPRLDFFRCLVLQFAGVTVDRSFDIWSLGMAVLHLYTGKSYFQDSSDPQVGEIAKLVSDVLHGCTGDVIAHHPLERVPLQVPIYLFSV